MTTLTEADGWHEVRHRGRVIYWGRDYLAAFLLATSLGYVVPMTPAQSRAYWQGVSGA